MPYKRNIFTIFGDICHFKLTTGEIIKFDAIHFTKVDKFKSWRLESAYPYANTSPFRTYLPNLLFGLEGTDARHRMRFKDQDRLNYCKSNIEFVDALKTRLPYQQRKDEDVSLQSLPSLLKPTHRQNLWHRIDKDTIRMSLGVYTSEEHSSVILDNEGYELVKNYRWSRAYLPAKNKYYAQTTYKINDKTRVIHLHRLLLILAKNKDFLKNPKCFIKFLNEDNLDCRFENMYVCHLAKYEPSGRKVGHKLTEAEVLAIRQEHSLGKLTQKEIGKKFSVSRTTVNNLVNRKHCKNI